MKLSKRIIVSCFFLGILLLLVGCSEKKIENLPVDLSQKSATIIKEESCGCCEKYVQYLRENGLSVTVNEITDVIPTKEQYEIPPAMRSCHTTLIDGYVFEGHIPLEAIAKLLAEKPNIKGIALPEMPSGSPGMAGQKEGTWIIYALNNDDSVSEFMRI